MVMLSNIAAQALNRPGFEEFARAKEEFEARKRERQLAEQLSQIALQKGAAETDLIRKKIELGGGEGTTPAALQLANEFLKAKREGNIERANAIQAFAKTVDKGVGMTPEGQYVPMYGYPQVLGQLEQGKQYGGELGKQEVRRDWEPGTAGMIAQAQEAAKQGLPPGSMPRTPEDIKSAETLATNQAQAVVKNDVAIGNLQNMEDGLKQIETALAGTSMTGPVLGRVANAVNDPGYENLQGAINSVVLQAKDLYNLGSGQGFTDADRNFLQEVISGKYSRRDQIVLGIARIREALKHRRDFLEKQNASYGQQVWSGGVPPVDENALYGAAPQVPAQPPAAPASLYEKSKRGFDAKKNSGKVESWEVYFR